MRISTSQIHQQGINAITRLSSQSADIQQQVATGRRVRTPADDPAAAAKIVRMNQDISARERYIQNADNAEAQLQQEEAVLTRVTDALQRVRELTLQAGDPAYSAADQATLGAELQVRFDELLSLVNSKDTHGNYLFSGFQGDVKPFEFVNGAVSYQGDAGERLMAIDNNRTIAVSDSGQDLFARAGVDFPAVSVRAVNAGGPPLLSVGATVTDFDVLSEQTAQRLRVDVRQAEGVTVLDVRDAADGTILNGLSGIPAGPLVDLSAIGIDLKFAEPAAAGDRFILELSQQQGLLTTVQKIATALSDNQGAGTIPEGLLRQSIDQSLVGIDAALDSVVGTQARIGARLNAVDSARQLHEDVVLKSQQVLSDVRDIDFAEAVSNLNFQAFLLEAAQQSFVRVNRLSLFNSL
ncbi:MAG: flagellar hook-associated protein FlgL [Pseudomonadales bacterium]